MRDDLPGGVRRGGCYSAAACKGRPEHACAGVMAALPCMRKEERRLHLLAVSSPEGAALQRHTGLANGTARPGLMNAVGLAHRVHTQKGERGVSLHATAHTRRHQHCSFAANQRGHDRAQQNYAAADPAPGRGGHVLRVHMKGIGCNQIRYLTTATIQTGAALHKHARSTHHRPTLLLLHHQRWHTRTHTTPDSLAAPPGQRREGAVLAAATSPATLRVQRSAAAAPASTRLQRTHEEQQHARADSQDHVAVAAPA